MYKNLKPLILASGSPRRLELLTGCGIAFEKIVSDIEEQVLPGESAEEMVERLSFEKGKAVAALHPQKWVLSADTTVVIDGKILNKPIDKEDSFAMLSQLQGRSHTVWTGICVQNLEKKIVEKKRCMTEVCMRKLTDNEIWWYTKTGEPADKAGSYAIQGVGASLISSVNGSYTNVVGLDISETVLLLKKYDVIGI